MTRHAFVEFFHAHGDELEAVEYEESSIPAVRHRKTHITLPLRSMCNVSDAEAIALLRGERSAVAVETLTRIVGYYSKTANWNSSKIGELSDRRKGLYNV